MTSEYHTEGGSEALRNKGSMEDGNSEYGPRVVSACGPEQKAGSCNGRLEYALSELTDHAKRVGRTPAPFKLAALSILLFAASLCGQDPGPAPQEPSQIYGVGAGIQGLGPSQIQGGYFVGQHIGTGRYVIESSDFVRLKGGGVGTAAHAGIYNRLASLGPLTLGVIGDAGVAEGATGSASGSFSGWGLAGVKLWKWPLTLTGVARIMTIAGSGNVAQVRLYLTLEIP
jgi:hypothetical protein